MTIRHACSLRGPVCRLPVAAAVALALLCLPGRALAQAPAIPDPHAAQPERPTVATHAHTVAPGWIEIETGAQRQQEGALADRLLVPLVVKIGLGARIQFDFVPGFERDAQSGRIGSGITDVVLAVKWRVADAAPVLGTFAIQPAVSLPTGSSSAGRGTGSAGVSLLAISSHQFGPVGVDVNVGYTRLGGDGSIAPQNSTMWTVSTGFPFAGRVAWVAEIYGYPGTSGPSGARPVVAFLTGPTLAVRPSLVLDAGAIFDVAGFGGTAVYAGLTWNIGRAWGAPPRQAATW
jgi:hypothetical protein